MIHEMNNYCIIIESSTVNLCSIHIPRTVQNTQWDAGSVLI